MPTSRPTVAPLGPNAGALLSELAAHCERCAPDEAVGVLVERHGVLTVRPLTNAVVRLAAAEPGRWPRTAGEGFAVAPSEWMALERELDATGGRLTWLYHSHVDHPPVLSAADRAFATVGGAPLVPGLRLLVLSVLEGRTASATAWSFREGTWAPEEPFGPERQSDLQKSSHLD